MYVVAVPVFKGQDGLRPLHTSVFLKGTQIPPTYPAMASDSVVMLSPKLQQWLVYIRIMQQTCGGGEFQGHVDCFSSREVT